MVFGFPSNEHENRERACETVGVEGGGVKLAADVRISIMMFLIIT